MEVTKPASWSAQDLRTRPVIPSGPAAFLTFTLVSFPPNVVLWKGDGMIIAALSAASWRAVRQICAAIASQSDRRRCLALRPAADLLSPLRRIYFQRNRWSSVPATCVESHWAWKCDSIFLTVPALSGSYCNAGERSMMFCTRSCSLTTDRHCMRQCDC